MSIGHSVLSQDANDLPILPFFTDKNIHGLYYSYILWWAKYAGYFPNINKDRAFLEQVSLE